MATDQLADRPPRPSDPFEENEALVGLTQTLASRPDALLDTLAQSILTCCSAESAGINILENEADDPTGNTRLVFRWQASAGTLSHYAEGTMPRHGSPCGAVIDRECPLLFQDPQRHFPELRSTMPPITEALLVPFYVDGRPQGTIWALTHDSSGRFDSEDLRLLLRLAHFAALCYRIRQDLETRAKTNKILRRAYCDQRTRLSRLRDFATELSNAEYRARHQFAAELQDNLQQMLVAARLQLAGGDNDSASAARASELIGKAVDVSRKLVSELRPPMLYELGLLPALRYLADQIEQQRLVEIQFDCDDADIESIALSNDARALLYESVRELLCNAIKHAGAKRASITVGADWDRATIAVCDDGHGTDIATAKLETRAGVGLFGIRERLASLGGSMHIDSTKGHGTRVELSVPLACAVPMVHDQAS